MIYMFKLTGLRLNDLPYLSRPEYPVLKFGPFQDDGSVLFAGFWHLVGSERKVIVPTMETESPTVREGKSISDFQRSR